MAIGKQPCVQNRDRQRRAAAGGGYTTSLRYYFAGQPPVGLLPDQMDGQAEILRVNVITPQMLALR